MREIVAQERLVDAPARDRRRQRQGAAGQGLRQRDEVGLDAGLLAREQRAGPAEARGNLVENQQQVEAASRGGDARQRLRRVELHAARRLHERLEDDRRRLPRMHAEHALEIARGFLGHRQRHDEVLRQHRMEQPMHSFLGIAHGHRREGVAVIAAAEAHEPRAALPRRG